MKISGRAKPGVTVSIALGGMAFLLGAALIDIEAAAEPLDKDACAALAQELQNLKALNVEKLMENGPEWAVSHLSPGDLSIVRRYIDADEQVKFRCTPATALVHLQGLEEDEEGAAPEKSAAGGEATPAGKTKEKARKAAGGPAASRKPKSPKPQKGASLKPNPTEATLGPNPAAQPQ